MNLLPNLINTNQCYFIILTQNNQPIIICYTNVNMIFPVNGKAGEKGLILGVLNHPSFVVIKEIPNNSTSSFNNFTIELPSNSFTWSLASDPKKSVVFAAISNALYIFENVSTMPRASITLPTEYKSRSVVKGQIAFDFVSNNLYWCDSLLNWIAMKPAYHFDVTIYKIIIHKDLFLPEGLALDPEEG